MQVSVGAEISVSHNVMHALIYYNLTSSTSRYGTASYFLFAILERQGREVLSWHLTKSIEANSCGHALKEQLVQIERHDVAFNVP